MRLWPLCTLRWPKEALADRAGVGLSDESDDAIGQSDVGGVSIQQTQLPFPSTTDRSIQPCNLDARKQFIKFPCGCGPRRGPGRLPIPPHPSQLDQ